MPKDERPVRQLTREEQFAIAKEITLRTRAKNGNQWPSFISNVERNEDNMTFYVSFTDSLSRDKWEALVEVILSSNKEYFAYAPKRPPTNC